MRFTASDVAAVFCLFSVLLARSEDLPRPPPRISSEIPLEVDAPVDPDLNEIAVFDDYSWRLFIALNWPAVPGSRGEPDTSKSILDGCDSDCKVVWETWKADYELFVRDGAEPKEWASFDGFTPCRDLPFEGSGHTMILGSFSGFSDFNQAGNGRFGGPLVAQNHTYVRFEIRMNEPEYDFIRDRKLYRPGQLLSGGSLNLRFPDNCISVKAAWKIIKADELPAARGRFYLADALLLDPVTNSWRLQKVGLVGLHIVQKTMVRPQWVWSSFEHVDNVPEPDAPASAGHQYSFNNPSKPQVLEPAVAPAPISRINPPSSDPNPMQVIRIKKISDSTKKTNEEYHALLRGTEWENYELVVTQWPKYPQPETENGAPFPGEFTGPKPMTNIANTTMETYSQKSAATSCMGCHDVARRKGSDFVWVLQLRPSGK
jgi:hypothetical protein